MLRKPLLLLILLSLLAPGPALAAWREAKTNHFVIYSEEPPQAVRAYAEKLERFDKVLRLLHGLPDEPPSTAGRVTVYVLRSPAEVAAMHGSRGSSVAGFYVPRARGSILFTPRASGAGDTWGIAGQTVLLHEYAHHYMLRNFSAAYPAWYVEGFAEFASTVHFAKNGGVEVGRPANHRASTLFSAAQLTMEEMLSGTTANLSPPEREDLYARGWALTHYLTFEPSRKGQLNAYLKALNAGRSPMDAARSAFGDLRQLERDLNRYIGGKMTFITIPAEQVPPPKVELRELTPGENATMAVRMQSDRSVNTAQAKLVVAEARRRAEPFPNDPGAQLALAEAEFDVGAYDAADAAAARAVAAKPDLTRALTYRGLVRMEKAKQAGANQAELLREARRFFGQANKSDPTDPDPLIHFYLSFGDSPNANAIQGLQGAFDQAPHDATLRMLVVRQHLLDNKIPQARALLAPLAFSPHSPAAKPAAALVARIDAGEKRDALLAELQKTTEAEDPA